MNFGRIADRATHEERRLFVPYLMNQPFPPEILIVLLDLLLPLHDVSSEDAEEEVVNDTFAKFRALLPQNPMLKGPLSSRVYEAQHRMDLAVHRFELNEVTFPKWMLEMLEHGKKDGTPQDEERMTELRNHIVPAEALLEKIRIGAMEFACILGEPSRWDK